MYFVASGPGFGTALVWSYTVFAYKLFEPNLKISN